MESRRGIKRGDVLSAMELIKQIVNFRQSKSLLNCKLVERRIVNHHAQLPTLLLERLEAFYLVGFVLSIAVAELAAAAVCMAAMSLAETDTKKNSQLLRTACLACAYDRISLMVP